MAGRSNPLDVDGPSFDVEAHISGLVKTKRLTELLDVEHEMVKEVQRLDMEVQTLVYENYSKFITATDTIRKMKADFVRMEDEMDALASAMTKITSSAAQVSDGLSGQREAVSKLSAASDTLKKLEFIFQLPANLQSCLERKDYTMAVKSYMKSKRILEKYKDLPAFAPIYSECEGLVGELREALVDEFRTGAAGAKEASTSLSFLLQLGEPKAGLAEEFIACSTQSLRKQLGVLEDESRLMRGEAPLGSPTRGADGGDGGRASDAIPNLPLDILEFVDSGCSLFLSDLSLMVTSYEEHFGDIRMVKEGRGQSLGDTIRPLLEQMMAAAEERFLFERNPSDAGLVVRALDRLYRRLQASWKVIGRFGGENWASERCLELILRVGREQIALSRETLHNDFMAQIKELRQLAVASQQSAFLTPGEAKEDTSRTLGGQTYADLVAKLENLVTTSLKTALANLLQFTATDVVFAAQDAFTNQFAPAAREELVVRFFMDLCRLSTDFCDGKSDKAYVNSTLILILSRFLKNMEASTGSYLLDLAEQQLRLGPDAPGWTPASVVIASLAQAAQATLDHYVAMEGQAISQLLVKSVQTRDWVGCVEPRGVRAVMKRMVEDVTLTEGRVGQLYPEAAVPGGKRDHSDSSRRSHTRSSASARPSHHPSHAFPDSALRDRLGKLWSERVDYFGSVEFNRTSIMEGIIKISLKTLLESIRLKSFNKYGVQQVQVDAHYLETHLWRFVGDETLLAGLLEEVVSSALHRSTEPSLMEPAVVDLICEQG